MWVQVEEPVIKPLLYEWWLLGIDDFYTIHKLLLSEEEYTNKILDNTDYVTYGKTGRYLDPNSNIFHNRGNQKMMEYIVFGVVLIYNIVITWLYYYQLGILDKEKSLNLDKNILISELKTLLESQNDIINRQNDVIKQLQDKQ